MKRKNIISLINVTVATATRTGDQLTIIPYDKHLEPTDDPWFIMTITESKQLVIITHVCTKDGKFWYLVDRNKNNVTYKVKGRFINAVLRRTGKKAIKRYLDGQGAHYDVEFRS